MDLVVDMESFFGTLGSYSSFSHRIIELIESVVFSMREPNKKGIDKDKLYALEWNTARCFT
jgi:hypothetical protein